MSPLIKHARAKHFEIQAYCFMPDHLHLLTNGKEGDANLLRFSAGFKQESAFTFKRRTGMRLWQKKYHDHILRANDFWQSVAWYVWNNPVRKKLCQRAEDWPFSGSFTLDWQKLLSAGVEPWSPPWKNASQEASRRQPSETKQRTLPG